MNELMFVKLAVAITAAAFLLSAGLRVWLTYISWPTERVARMFGALTSALVAVAYWPLVGHGMEAPLYPLLLALLLLSLWQVIDVIRAIAGVAGHRIEVMKEVQV